MISGLLSIVFPNYCWWHMSISKCRKFYPTWK